MKMDKFEVVIDGIQSILVWFVIILVALCIATLILFDALAGTGTMLYLTGGKEWQSVVISLATTGLLFALMLLGYMMGQSEKEIVKGAGVFAIGLSLLIYVIDVIFDALLADVLRFGTLTTTPDGIHWLFRILIGGISTVGDGMGIAMVMGMPVLKGVIQNAIGSTKVVQKPPQSVNQQTNKPSYGMQGVKYPHENTQQYKDALRDMEIKPPQDLPPFMQKVHGGAERAKQRYHQNNKRKDEQ